MAVKVISGYDDPAFKYYENYFWSFCPDDWDYMIIGDSKNEVENLAEKLQVFNYEMALHGDRWIAVTYHS